MSNQRKLIEVDRDDLRAICNAVLASGERYEYHEHQGDTLRCEHCGEWVFYVSDTRVAKGDKQNVIVHGSDCPVLIARSVQPRPPKKGPK